MISRCQVWLPKGLESLGMIPLRKKQKHIKGISAYPLTEPQQELLCIMYGRYLQEINSWNGHSLVVQQHKPT